MKRWGVWFAVLAMLVTAAQALAGTSSGCSNAFGIDNLAGDTRICPPMSWSTSPYDNNAGWHLLRGQLHDHSEPDVGVIYDLSGVGPYEQVRKYRDVLGYDFLALTDHDHISLGEISWPIGSDPWVGWAPRSVEITHGPVPRDAHVLAIGTNTSSMDDLDSPSTWPDVAAGVINRVAKVHARDGLALIAHPSAFPANPYCLTAGELERVVRVSRPDAMSIYQKVSHSEGLWDRVLRDLRSPVWGYSEDDYHPDVASRWFKGTTWVAVPGMDGTGWDVIKQKLRDGSCYTYWITGGSWPSNWGDPPRLRVSVDGAGTHPLIYAQLQDASGSPYSVNIIRFIGSGGQNLYSTGGSSASYQCRGWEGYVRVRVWQGLSGGRTMHIASQPIFVHGYGVRASGAGGMSVADTSPGLIVSYLQPDDMPPLPPPAGYVGPAFDVSTATGEVPPAATLQLSYEGEDVSDIGGTDYLAIYHYDPGSGQWVKVGGTLSPGYASIEAQIDALGIYTISGDVPQDTVAPDVFIDDPPCGGVVVADTTVNVSVNDELGAYQVNFCMNDHLFAQDSDYLDGGWSAQLSIADYCTGDWTLKAVAEDLSGNQGTAEISVYINSSTPRPTVAITSPTDGSGLTGTVTATGTCWDDAAVATLLLYADDTLVGLGEWDDTGSWTAQVDTTTLADGPRTLTAVVEDYPGNMATASVTVMIDNSAAAAPIGDVKKLPDGTDVRFADGIVVADASVVGDGVYVESTDRAAGIRVITGADLAVGDSASVVGTMATQEHERVVVASDLQVLSSNNPLPLPLGMTNLRLGGGPYGDYTPGVSGGSGLHNIGLLVRTWGRVTQVGEGYLYIDDGSGIRDGTTTAEEENIGVRVVCDTARYGIGDRVAVTGVSSCFENGAGRIARRLLPRGTEDIRRFATDPVPVSSITAAKSQKIGTRVRLENLVITATYDQPGRGFYAEAQDRSSGIRLTWPTSGDPGIGTVVTGDVITTQGVVGKSSDGEVELLDAYPSAVTGHVEPLAPLALTNRNLGGGPTGLQEGVLGGSGLNNIGLFVHTWGRITQIAADYLYIDDGSGLRDGTLTGAQENVGVRVICDPLACEVGDYVVITGISSCFENSSGQLVRRVFAHTIVDLDKPTATISGSVALQGYLADKSWMRLTVDVRRPGATIGSRLTTRLAGDGTYELKGVPLGTYDLAYRSDYSLRKVLPSVTVTGDLSDHNVTLIYGDLKTSNSIGLEDWAAMTADFGTSNPRSDVNGDGIVDYSDWEVISPNLELMGDP